MSNNEPKVPRGEFAVLADHSSNGRTKVIPIGSLVLREDDLLSIVPLATGRRNSPGGYPAKFSISADVGHSVWIEIKQLTGDKREIDIWKRAVPGKPIEWSFNITRYHRGVGPFKLIMYPELEQLLDYLIELE